MRTLLTITLLLALATPALATTRRVPQDYATIQAGITAAVAGDTVLVACGTYNENSITMKSGVILRSATGLFDCATINAGATTYRVMTCTSLASGTVVEGFTLMNGRNSTGAGVSCSGSSVLFKQCKFTGNTATSTGGGIYIPSGSPAFVSCTFQSNSATQGGGAYISGGSPSFTTCTFLSNTATSATNGGGGVYCTGTTASFSHCAWTTNTAQLSGALYAASAITMHGCTFTSNTATAGNAGAIRLYNAGTVQADSCSFASNTATAYGGALDVDGSTLVLARSTVSGNSAASCGAIYCRNSATLTATDTDVSNNSASGASATGAAISAATATVQLDRCTFNQNHITTTGSSGGALYLSIGGSSYADSCTFYHNAAGKGGGIYVSAGNPTFSNCSFSTNTASASSQYGGGAYCTGSTTASFNNCTLTGNSAAAAGGIYADAGIQMTGCTLGTNAASTTVGGGASFTANSSSSVVTNCTFDHNTAVTNGGGINVASAAKFYDCIFSYNTGATGGGGAGTGAATFEDCQFLNNTAGTAGGLSSSSITVNRCVFTSNAATSGAGGGLVIGGGSVDSTSFTSNTAATTGGGLHGVASVTNCTIQQNTCVTSGGGLYASGALSLSNCIIRQNNATGASSSGGGVYCPGCTVAGCQITSNTAKKGGGFIGDSVTMSQCQLSGNIATSGMGGGGVQSNGTSQFTGCTFGSNSSTSYGGGWGAENGTATFTDCVFNNNTAANGGGVINATLNGCTFSRNRATTGRGGAVYYSAAGSPSNCTFDRNVSGSTGAAIYSTVSTNLTDCVFFKNLGGEAAVYYSGTSAPTITRCTFARNTSGVYCLDSYSTRPTVNGCIFAFNEVRGIQPANYTSPSCTDIYGNKNGDWVGNLAYQLPTNNNMEVDPQFCDRISGDLHLGASSPCLNHPICGRIGALGQGCDSPLVRDWLVPSLAPTIQAAVDSAWAGDTITVESGFAGANADIAKRGLFLRGGAQSPDSVSAGYLQVTYGDGMTIQKLTLRGVTWSGTGTVSDCRIVRSQPQISQAVIYLTGGTLAIEQTTLAYNRGRPIDVGSGATATVASSIIACNEYPPFDQSTGTITLSCTDIYGNYGGDWAGPHAGQQSLNGNLSVDPLFCDPSGSDFHLAGGSPCLAAPGCGRIGAEGEGCTSPTPLRTWHVPSDTPTIAAALSAAWLGDTVAVASGVYHEHYLDLKSGVTLRSESGDPDSVTIDADGLGWGVYAGRYSVTRGLRVTNAKRGYSASDMQGGIYCVGSGARVQDCALIRNLGHGLQIGATGVEIENCTSALNGWDGIYLQYGSLAIGGTISAFNAGAAFGSTSGTSTMTCCDLYGNSGGDWVGPIAGQEGVAGNISKNPMFCDLAAGDLRLAGGSPCLNDPTCGRIGAHGQGCDQTAPGRVWDVPIDAPTIQAAIDSTVAGDTISVACGTYTEHDISLKPAIVLKSAIGEADCAVIDAGSLGRVINATNARDSRIEDLSLIRGATALGAGIYAQNAESLAVDGCVFYANRASQGGGIYCDAASPVFVTNCSFGWNEASSAGGCVWTQSPVTVDGSILALCQTGNAVVCDGAGSATLTCTDVFRNAGGDWTGCISGQSGTAGNLSVDPLFCHIGSGDLHLAAVSPCLSAPGCGLLGALGQGCDTQILARAWRVPSEVLTIQAAIDSAAAGDTVLVACGTYTWTGEGSGTADGLIRMKNHVVLRSETGLPECVTINAEDQGRVIHCSAPSTATVIEGFTITGGLVTGSGRNGAGMYHINDATTVRSCRILDNMASSNSFGGGIYLEESVTEFSNCEFTNNTGTGGAIYSKDEPPYLLPGPRFESCIFRGNSGYYGSAAYLVGFVGSFSGCLAYGQSAAGSGVFHLVASTEPSPPASTFDHTIIAFNTTGTSFTSYGYYAVPPVLSCCDIYGNSEDYGSWLGTQLGVRGNIRLDPEFCDRVNGDFHLGSLSPCLNATCGVMGPYGEGECGLSITAIRDIVADQGGEVRVRWRRAYTDALSLTPPITSYALWRRVDDSSGKGGRPDLNLKGPDPVVPVELTALPPGEWDCVTTVPAMQMDIYSVVSPTLCDSTPAQGICWSRFCVTAHTSTPSIYYTSDPDSGYSVDNLVPSAPTHLRFSAPRILAWDSCPDPDFDYFTVYGSAHPSLGDSAVVIAYTTDPTQNVTGQRYTYYHVTATDFSGNEGLASTILGTNPAAVPDEALPKVFSLYANAPNPFHGSTMIRFDLPEARLVRLSVYGIDGRLVCRLVDAQVPAGSHRVQWRGIDDSGRPVASGIYFCRLVAGDYASNKRMVLTR
jgi:hypothetical protein